MSDDKFELYLQSYASITGDEKLLGTFPTREKAEEERDSQLGGVMNRSTADYDIREKNE